MIYLDNAATTLHKPPCVARAVTEAMSSFGNSGRGAHEDALTASRIIYDTRERLAALFHCAPERVCFTCNSTEALNIAISGLFDQNDHVISTDWEHNSVLRPLYRLRDAGMGLDFLKADKSGRLNLDKLPLLLHKNTKAVVCTHASNLTGDVMDIYQIGAFCRAHGLIFILDASQSAAVMPIDMERDGVDVVCFTGHKSLMGPQGTGGLCIREGLNIRPWKVGGTGVQSYLEYQPEEYPTRLEAGTLNGHGIAGLRAALIFLEEKGPDSILSHECELSLRFRRNVSEVPGVTLYGNWDTALHAPIVTFNIGDLDSSEVSDELAERWGIASRPGAHCAPRLHRALGTQTQGAVRFSWSFFSTEEETDRAAEAVTILAREWL